MKLPHTTKREIVRLRMLAFARSDAARALKCLRHEMSDDLETVAESVAAGILFAEVANREEP